VLGGRGFSIWNSGTGTQVFNSGDRMEQITSADPRIRNLFNAGNSAGDNTRKNRSDNKGPEPEGVAVGKINDTTYAFIALERVGGVMAFDVTNPASPTFVDYINTRDTGASFGGDQGAEGIIFIPAKNHPSARNYVVTANETSASVAVFEVKATDLPIGIGAAPVAGKHLNVYPNPVRNDQLFFSRPVSGRLTDLQGRTQRVFQGANHISTAGLSRGIYFLLAEGFATQKIILE
jgi:hypothetical protein